ncbi:pleiotropic drug resistance protein 5-like [Dorcoceras hygrometricum]|uniref:Pleiotropic drug resistance protein 5-like n=1 Tax=Dorcoceras hygrometricum TaxID=472368 RepID=A0A2Z7BNQ8_9LAMI|nr:pleiotropic drug resistance protein 5-like [Dorcoceras hygrometricum]
MACGAWSHAAASCAAYGATICARRCTSIAHGRRPLAGHQRTTIAWAAATICATLREKPATLGRLSRGKRTASARNSARCGAAACGGVGQPTCDKISFFNLKFRDFRYNMAQLVFSLITLLATRAWLRPVSRGNRHFTVGGGRLRQSGPRPEARLLRQPALEGLTRSARTDSPRQVGRNKFRRERRRRKAAAAVAFERGEGGGHLELGLGFNVVCRSRTPQNPLPMLNTLSSVSVRESRIQYLCDPQWFRDTASRGPTTIVAPESQFRTCPMDHDSIGYPRMSASGESSTTMHRLLHASGSHPIPTPYDPKDIVVYSLAVERIPASFRRIFQQSVYTDGFVGYFSDLDVQSIPEFDSTSSDGSTVYRSPSPQVESFEEAESVEPSAHLALGPAISGVAQEEQSYFVESPESPPHTFQRQDTSASSSDSPMHLNSDDIPLDVTADVHPTLPAVTVDLSPLLDDLKISLSKRMDDAQSDILSRLRTIERGLQDTLGQQNEYFRNLIQSARQDGKNQDDIQTLRFNAFQKVVNSLDGQGEGSSSRRPLPPPVNQGEGSGGDTVRTTDIAQRDIDNAQRNKLERLMAADRQRERERDLVQFPVNQGEGSGGDTVRTTDIAQRDIDNAQRNKLERLMAADRQRERERDSGSETVGLSNQVFELSGQIVTVENALRAMVAANKKDYITNSILDRYGNSEVQQEQYYTVNSEGCCQQRCAY